jgi:hypothetical protein
MTSMIVETLSDRRVCRLAHSAAARRLADRGARVRPPAAAIAPRVRDGR